ncbi:MAG: type 4a pilus biogenesis protein PilO [Acidobacteriota bacterium]
MDKNKIVIYAALSTFLISIVLIITSFFYTSLKKISVKNIDSRYDTFQARSNEFEKLNNTYIDWQNVGSDFKSFKDKYLIKFDDFPRFRKNLKLAFTRNYLTETGFKLNYSTVLKGELIRTEINFKLSGQYKNIKKFIFDISKMDKIVFFRSVKLQKTNKNIIGDFFMEVYLVK